MDAKNATIAKSSSAAAELAEQPQKKRRRVKEAATDLSNVDCSSEPAVKRSRVADAEASDDNIDAQESIKSGVPDDDELQSYKHHWNESRRRRNFGKGNVVMVKWRKYARWPYVVSNVKKGRATLFQLPRTFPIVKRSKPDLTVNADKLEPYQKFSCDITENYSSQDAAIFIQATRQADVIVQKNLDPFKDHVVHEIEREDTCGDDIATETAPAKPLNNITMWGLEISDDEDWSDDEIEILPETSVGGRKPGNPHIDELLEGIKSECTEAYLIRVMRKEVTSHRFDEFYKLEMTGRLHQRWFRCSPFDDQFHIENVLEYLHDIKRVHAPTLFGLNGDAFVESVLLPEAVKFSLRTLWKLADDEADKILTSSAEYFLALPLNRN